MRNWRSARSLPSTNASGTRREDISTTSSTAKAAPTCPYGRISCSLYRCRILCWSRRAGNASSMSTSRSPHAAVWPRPGAWRKSCARGRKRRNKFRNLLSRQLTQDLLPVFHFQPQLLEPVFRKTFPGLVKDFLFFSIDVFVHFIDEVYDLRVKIPVLRIHAGDVMHQLFHAAVLLQCSGHQILCPFRSDGRECRIKNVLFHLGVDGQFSLDQIVEVSLSVFAADAAFLVLFK